MTDKLTLQEALRRQMRLVQVPSQTPLPDRRVQRPGP